MLAGLDAPSLYIAERLLQMGARVKAYDPIAMNACRRQRSDLKIRYCESVREVAKEADALVVVTEWNECGAIHLAALAPLMTKPILAETCFHPKPPPAPASITAAWAAAWTVSRRRSGAP